MDETTKNTGSGKVLSADFKSETKIQRKKPALESSTQSNPILTKLFKLSHVELSKHKEDYKSFNKFTPDDLR
jgi:hypothetical protein